MHFLVFQHVPAEHPGHFADLWREDGITWHTIQLDFGEPIPADFTRYDALLVMGGPMDVWEETTHPWLAAEKQAIRDCVVGLEKPFFGICLGHQLLADALGGEVGPGITPEIGVAPVTLTPAGRADPLFAGFPPDVTTLQWHGAEIKNLPDQATILAANPACAVQSFRWGRHAYGVQFHPEITAGSVADFQAIPAYSSYLETHLGPGAPARLSAETAALLPEFHDIARRFHRNFCKLLTRNLTGCDSGPN